MTFDEQVKELRGKVVPRRLHKTKANATPEEWAAKLDYEKRLYNRPDQRERARVWGVAYRQVNAEKLRAYANEYSKANRKRLTARFLARRKSDPQFRLLTNLRTRLNAAIKGSQRAGSAISDLGCTIAELWVHLESKFQPGMTRENWGDAWVIDHIYPLAKADLTNRVQFLAVSNWRNLQPVTHLENKTKKDKVTDEAQSLFNSLVKEFGQRSPAS